jgi:hypothetical protein
MTSTVNQGHLTQCDFSQLCNPDLTRIEQRLSFAYLVSSLADVG